ncbi:hypothetical protein [Sciscionella marina]|uniref:hypothetical protein n=1 Tax=Sciscionella marina TaxID=508770 RepID=UPI00038207A5|nr:hypothetical protein [Sciscionella marina]
MTDPHVAEDYDSPFGPDGTASPPPGLRFVDPLAGLVTSNEYQDTREDPYGRYTDTEVPDPKSLQATVEAKLAEQKRRAREEAEQAGPVFAPAEQAEETEKPRPRRPARPQTRAAQPQQQRRPQQRGPQQQRNQQQKKKSGAAGCIIPLIIFVIIILFNFYDKIKALFE